MSTPASPDTDTDTSADADADALRTRVTELETELTEQAVRTNRLLAEAQERYYWLDRWHLDLNALMARPGAAEFRALIRVVRAVVRRAKRLKRRLTG